MNSPPGSAIPYSHDVSEMLVTNPIAEVDAGIILTTAPAEPQVEASPLDAGARTPTSSSWWQRATGRSGGAAAGVTVRHPREPESPPDDVTEAHLPPAPPLSPQSLHTQLETLTLRAAIADTTARIAVSEQTTALAHRATAEHLLATEELTETLALRSRATSPTASQAVRPLSPQLVFPADSSDLVRVLQSLEDRHRADRQAAEAREERYHRAAEERALAREAEYRAERAATDARFAALMASDRRPATRHVIGSALREACPAFEGKPGQDISEWLAEFLRLASAHEIPSAFLSNELIIKLKGKAAKWFQTAFPDAADVSPPWTDLQSALLHHFTRRYTAAGAHRDLHGARRLPGTTGPEAVQRVAELVLALSLKGVPLAAGPNEQLAYIYQNQLSEEEFSRWSAAANAHHQVSDAALAALESAASADRGTTSRLSCSSETREQWFHGRAEHIRSFLMDQAKALGGPDTPARAAVAAADGSADVVVPAPAGAAGGSGGSGPTSVPGISDMECRLRVAYADRGTSSAPPPEYFGANAVATQAAANKTEFEKRKTCGACFACHNTRVQYGTFHLDCRQHGRNATPHQRADKAFRVPGSLSTCGLKTF